jgi:hypothetical protein
MIVSRTCLGGFHRLLAFAMARHTHPRSLVDGRV